MAGKYGAAGSGRNHGYGRDMAYAGQQALVEYYGGGHFSTVATHSIRFTQFAEWAREQGVRDIARNDPAQLLRAFAEYVGREVVSNALTVAYGQNLISSAQVTLRAMTGDGRIRVSPSEYCGSRTNVRSTAPGSLDRSAVEKAVAAMHSSGLDRAAAVVVLARELGMREREAILADLPRLASEAQERGAVDIQEGTKGGRTAERLVPASAAAHAALRMALAASPSGSRNLLAPGQSYKQFVASVLRAGRQNLKEAGIVGYHDCRAGYACERYAALSGHAAPAVAGARRATRELDMKARRQITHELGHGRIDVVVTYIGGAK